MLLTLVDYTVTLLLVLAVWRSDDMFAHGSGSSPVPQLQLTVSPAGPILEGGTVFIRCQVVPASAKQPLDLLRLIRNVDGQTYDLTNNDLLGDVYRRTGRYSVSTWNDELGLVELRIEHALGIDGGHIGCRLLADEHSPPDTFTDLIINVPPRSVRIFYQSGDGEVHWAQEAEALHLPQGLLTTVTCQVTTADTDFTPEVKITSEHIDVTSRFTHNSSVTPEASRASPTPIGFARYPERNYEYKLRLDASTGSELVSNVHGRNLTCAAKLQHFGAVVASVRPEIAYKPQVQCDREYGGLLNEVDFEVRCLGRSHPAPHNVVWSWSWPQSTVVVDNDDDSDDDDDDDERSDSEAANRRSLNAAVNGKQNGGRIEIVNGAINKPSLNELYSATMSATRDAQFEFILRVSKLQMRDFRHYELEVTNEMGTAMVGFDIKQVFASTPRRPTMKPTVMKPENADQPAEPWQSISGSGARWNGAGSNTALVTSLISAVIATVFRRQLHVKSSLL